MAGTVSLIFPLLMIFAALRDVTSFKIPNRIVMALAATWPLAALYVELPWGAVWGALLLALIFLVIGFILFAQNLLGAGDVKLLSVAALWVGAGQISLFALSTALAGAVLAFGLLFFRQLPLPVHLAGQAWVVDLHARHRVMPYGVAIAAGALICWPRTAFYLFAS